MRKLLVMALLCIGLPLLSFSQVSFDTDGKISIHTAAIEKRLNLFPEVRDLKDARIKQGSDNNYLVLISTASGKKVQLTISEDQLDIIRGKYDSYLDANNVKAKVPPASSTGVIPKTPPNIRTYAPGEEHGGPKTGKRLLIGSMCALGFGAWGWMLPVSLASEDISAKNFLGKFYGSYLVIGGSIALTGIFIEPERVSIGAAKMFAGAGTVGLVHGTLLGVINNGLNDSFPPRLLLSSSLVSIVEAIGGYAVAQGLDLSSTQVKLITSSSLWYAFGGLSGAGAFGAFEGNADPYGKTTATTMLISSLGGYVIGGLVAKSSHFTEGDARVYNTFMPLPLLGVFSGFTAGDVLDEKSFWTSQLIATIGGSFLGAQLVKKTDFTSKQGAIITASTAGGAAMGTGIGLLFFSNTQKYDPNTNAISSSDENLKYVPVLSSALSLGAFALSYYLLRDNALQSYGKVEKKSRTNLSFEPTSMSFNNYRNNTLNLAPALKLRLDF